MKVTRKRKHGRLNLHVEGRRAHRKTNNRYPFLDLDFVDEEPLDVKTRVLYGVGAVGCVILAVIGAIFPVLPAIPFWVLAVICLSHAFPGFGRLVRESRLYRWLIAKLNEPEKKTRRPIMRRQDKNRIMWRVSLGVLALVAFVVLTWRVVRYPGVVAAVVSVVTSLIWVISWFYLFIYVREPEATIKPDARKTPRDAVTTTPSGRRLPPDAHARSEAS
ncbi:DUF454 family protein [Olsenella massiliensis]|uniref:DUF454 family protein n=1 Tax=Olsenella massiliensis TaxID=1622075 RepID=UPI00071D649C|nr:DUF454 family protein [Olsenella massiliensis]